MLVTSLLALVVGLALLIAGATLLVRGASRLARSVGVSPLIIGLTIVAYGTSMPEMVVSVNAAVQGEAGIALGNVVGSNIFNVLAILGISALVAPLAVSSRLVRIDVPLMIGVSIVLLIMALDGSIGGIEGALLVAGLLAYTAATWLWQSRSGGAASGIQESSGVRREGRRPVALALDVGAVAVGLATLVFGAQQAVAGATGLAAALRISALIVGLTIVAAGTSLPELATSVMASFRGERDLAVGNVVGSNIFNILGVQGLASVVSWSGVSVDPSAVRFDLPVMVVVAVACLPIFFTGYVIARWEGALFIGYFLAYLTYIYLQAAQREAQELFHIAMIAFVIPLTVITLATIALREFRRKRAVT